MHRRKSGILSVISDPLSVSLSSVTSSLARLEAHSPLWFQAPEPGGPALEGRLETFTTGTPRPPRPVVSTFNLGGPCVRGGETIQVSREDCRAYWLGWDRTRTKSLPSTGAAVTLTVTVSMPSAVVKPVSVAPPVFHSSRSGEVSTV